MADIMAAVSVLHGGDKERAREILLADACHIQAR